MKTMILPTSHQIAQMERLLGESLRHVASDLRLIDVEDFLSFIRTGQIANLRTIVQSSTELFFKPSTLTLAETAEAAIAWETKPFVVLTMRFRARGISVSFRLRLGDREAGVDIGRIEVDGDAVTEQTDLTERLATALKHAQIPARSGVASVVR